MKITIGGEAGSGKGTLKDALKKKLGYETWSMGDMRREIAEKHGLTIHQLNELGKKESWTDKEVDEFQKQLSRRENVIVEGRLSWYFIPNSFKIYLKTDSETAAKRIFEHQRNSEENNDSLEKLKQKTEQRKQNDIERYKKYYDINPYEPENYDLVIDTTNKTPEEVLNIVLDNLENGNK